MVLARAPKAPPFVLLWGWLGCKERHLNKYADMWRQLGAEPYVMSMDTWTIVAPGHERAFDELLPRVDSAVEAYTQHSLAHGGDPTDPVPVLQHTFSNTGYLTLGSLAAAAAWRMGFPTTHRTHARDRFAPAQAVTLRRAFTLMGLTRGCVVDSAPSHHTPEVWTKGIEAALQGSWLAPVQTALYRAFYRERISQQLAEGDYREFLDEAMAGWKVLRPKPTLWLYSAADDVVPAEHVEEAALASRLAPGAGPSIMRRWEDSEHVMHYRRHPEEYAQLCKDFLKLCTEQSPAKKPERGRR